MHLKINQIHLWQIPRLHSPQHYEQCLQTLNAAEIARANRYLAAEHRIRFTMYRGACKMILAHYLSTKAVSLQFLQDEHGKPYLPSNDLHFNLSHSDDLALLAISQQPLGIDIEKIMTKDLMPLAHRFFHPDEYAFLLSCSTDQRQEQVYWLWARKEAWLKANGKGLKIPLSQFSVLPIAETVPITHDQQTWYLQTLNYYPGYAACLASTFSTPDLRHYTFTAP